MKLKEYIPILIIQLAVALVLLLKDVTKLDLFLQNFMLTMFYSCILIFLSLKFNLKAERFVYVITALMNIGLALQTYLVGSASYTFKIVLISLVVSLLVIIANIKFKGKISKKTIMIIFIVSNALIILFLLVSVALKGVGNVYTTLSIGSLSLQIVLFIVPIFVVIQSLILTSKLSSFKKYLSVCSVLIINILALFVFNELGSALMVICVFLILNFVQLELRYTVISLVAFGLLFLAVGSILYSASVMYDNGVNNGLVNFLNIVFNKLVSRFSIVNNLFENKDGYQLVQARKAIAVGGLFGSKIEVYIPVAQSDMAFAYMSLKFGFIACTITVILFVSLLVYGNKLIQNTKLEANKLIAIGFIHSIVLQAFLTIIGSCGLIPLTGIPIAFISKGGSYMIIVSIELFFIALCNIELKMKGALQCKKQKIARAVG